MAATDWAKNIEEAEAELALALTRPASSTYKDRSEVYRTPDEIRSAIEYMRQRLAEDLGESEGNGLAFTDYEG